MKFDPAHCTQWAVKNISVHVQIGHCGHSKHAYMNSYAAASQQVFQMPNNCTYICFHFYGTDTGCFDLHPCLVHADFIVSELVNIFPFRFFIFIFRWNVETHILMHFIGLEDKSGIYGCSIYPASYDHTIYIESNWLCKHIIVIYPGGTNEVQDHVVLDLILVNFF